MARARDKVVVGYVHPQEVGANFHDSMMNMQAYDISRGHLRMFQGPKDDHCGGRIGRYSSANISNARNWVVATFLEKSSAEWLLFIDCDMSFEQTLLEDILTNASISKAPVVGGLCFGIDEGVLFPTLYGVAQGWEDDAGIHTIRYDEYPPNSMFQVAATGGACLLIHRTVLEKVRDVQKANGNTAYPWFQETTFNGYPCGEDVTFCHRVNAAGFPVYVDTGVKLGHAKTAILTEDMYLDQRSALTSPALGSSQPGAGADPPQEEAP